MVDTWIKGLRGNFLGQEYQKKWDEYSNNLCKHYYGNHK